MCIDLPQQQEPQITASPLPYSFSKDQPRTLLNPFPHSQSSEHGRDVPPSWPEGPGDIKGTDPCFVLAAFRDVEKQQNGEGAIDGDVSLVFIPQVG